MGARKVSKKKSDFNRHIIMLNRRKNWGLNSFSNYNGTITYLNFARRILTNKPYKNQEFQKEFLRYINQMQPKTIKK